MRAPMSALSEFDLIEKLFAPLATAPGAFGLKDDVATIAPNPGHDLVVTTDAIVEGVDFFASDPAASVARKALRVNLSDLAAKGAEPVGYLLTLSLPRDFSVEMVADFAHGLRDDQEHYEIGLFGGDLSSTPGPLTISITAFGYVPTGKLVRRGGACVGDLIFVTGTIGDSGGGLALLSREGDRGLSVEHRNHLIDRYRLPAPPVMFGTSLKAFATAAIDVSDGLIADLGHLAEASGARVTLTASRIPRSDALRALWCDDIVRAATAGDDYQIAFTAPESLQGDILNEARIAGGVQVTCIGRVDEGTGVALLDAKGREIAVPRPGYRHF